MLARQLGLDKYRAVAGRPAAQSLPRRASRLVGSGEGDGLRILRAATARQNARSQNVLTKAGFVPVGPADPADPAVT